MEDLAGIGRAVEKFLGLVQSSIGTLYRPRALRQEGKAKADAGAYQLVTEAKAAAEVSLINFEAEQTLAERTAARLRHQEMTKQENLESIIDRTIPRIEHQTISSNVDED